MSKVDEARKILDEVLKDCLKAKNKSRKGGSDLTLLQWRNRPASSAFAIVGLMEHQIAVETFDKAALRRVVDHYSRSYPGADYSHCFGAVREWPDGREEEKQRQDEAFFK